jgi:hypothetical protein
MDRQLHLLTDDDTRSDRRWRLDPATKAVGRRGLAQARAALRAAARAAASPEETTPRLLPQSSGPLRRPGVAAA